MQIAIETITPLKAEAWLNLNTRNRALREGVAEKYADDMANGRWTTCPEPLSFFEDDTLADGQHRLFAIIMSGVSVRMPVARGLKLRDGLNINRGLGRSLVDNARISGVGGDLSNALIAVARAYATGSYAAGALSDAAKIELVDDNREPSEWALARVRHVRYLCNTAVTAAVARAWAAGADEAKLERFCAVLGTGMAEGMNESAAVAIRNYLVARAAAASLKAAWRDTFLKVQNAIAYFVAGKKLTVIKGVADEAYPLKKPGKRRAA